MDQEELGRHMRQSTQLLQDIHRAMQPLPLWAYGAVVIFSLLVLGAIVRFTWQVDDSTRQAERSVAEVRAQPARPTVHERLDALEERVRALEQHQSPRH
jgi:hypothetical protein